MTLITPPPALPEDPSGSVPGIKFGEFIASAVLTASSVAEDQPPVTISHPLLNGVPYGTFRREIDIDTRRELGARCAPGPSATDWESSSNAGRSAPGSRTVAPNDLSRPNK
jgi:hypothetical protein